MSNELLVRVYDVHFGDAVFVRVPDDDDYYCILIDSGTSSKGEPLLKDVLNDVKTLLPDDENDPSKKRLDLLVATHPHADHIKGFDPDWFDDLSVRHIWLSAFMKEDHPQATNSLALSALADTSALSLINRGLALSPGLDALLRKSICNTDALDALRNLLPAANGIEPLYVARDVARKLTSKQRKSHSVSYRERTTSLNDFKEDDSRMRVLAPEWNIDEYYLGEESDSPDYSLVSGLAGRVREDAADEIGNIRGPSNISERDFRLLREAFMYSALSFSQKDSDLKNNTSVVLLLEWRGRRLLFTGDAEWTGRPVELGRDNGAWDVLLEEDEQRGHLSGPIDFLKVGHHGSVNGTPFDPDDGADQPVLDVILPVGGDARAVVSTHAGTHGEQFPVPYAPLMAELGRRISNACIYTDDPDLPNTPQPPRTDYEGDTTDTGIYAIDITFDAAPGWGK